MDFLSLLIIAVGLSMDAFAVSICKGLSMSTMSWRRAAVAGLWFGGFQALMPLVGYFVGVQFAGLIADFDHWIAFALLVLIGVQMIVESRKNNEKCDCDFSFRSMLLLSLATSIDALAVGVSFAFLDVDIWRAVAVIGVVTFLFSVAGVKVGNMFGAKYKSGSELIGGLILIVIGIKILLEHLLGK